MSTAYDVAVIGGGPAGMIAAGRAAELGARVVLLEKNSILGKKLLITGGGRCNILNAEFDAHRLAERYGNKGKSLLSVFSKLDAEATVHFFESRGLNIMIEDEKRAFPVSENAADVRGLLVQYMNAGGVKVETDLPVLGLEKSGRLITKIVHDSGTLEAKNYILATGGKSRPETGSTGDGFRWMADLGHTIIAPDPALVPIVIRNPWIKNVEGISLQGVRLSIFQNDTKHDSRVGKLLFTYEGLSGPLVLNMSKRVGDLLKSGPVTISLDLFPSVDHGALDRKVLEIFEEGKNKMIRNTIGALLQPRLGREIIDLAGIDPVKPLHQLTREERTTFVHLLKDLRLSVAGLLGPEKAIVTGGGVALKEVEFQTMQSKLYSNLFLCGDILDFDRPSGGFSLQICWSTGYVAGTSAAQILPSQQRL